VISDAGPKKPQLRQCGALFEASTHHPLHRSARSRLIFCLAYTAQALLTQSQSSPTPVTCAGTRHGPPPAPPPCLAGRPPLHIDHLAEVAQAQVQGLADLVTYRRQGKRDIAPHIELMPPRSTSCNSRAPGGSAHSLCPWPSGNQGCARPSLGDARSPCNGS
jgi:hypothetical protein